MTSDPEHSNHQDTVLCYNCHHRIPSRSKFCPHCGQRIIQAKYCLNCKLIMDSDSSICKKCGTETSENIFCGSCFNKIPREADFCPFCGSKIEYRLRDQRIEQVSRYDLRTSLVQKKQSILRLPIFFILFTIFGLDIALQFIVVILFSFIAISSELTPDVVLILTIVSRLIQISLIYLIITNSRSFIDFRPFKKKMTIIHELEELVEEEPKLREISIFSVVNFIIIISLVLYLLEALVFLIINFIKDFFSISNPIISPYMDYFKTDNTILLFFILAVIIAPFAEELLFRGFLQHSFDRSKLPDWSHYFLQALLFAFAHLLPDIVEGSTWDFIIAHMISTGAFAIGATWLMKKYGKIIYPILLHALGNFISVGLVTLVNFLPSDTDFLFLDIAITTLSVFITLVLLFTLKIRNQWHLSSPALFKSFKNNKEGLVIKLMFLSIFFAVLFNLANIIPFYLSEDSVMTYILAISLITILLLIFWPMKIVDRSIDEIKKSKMKK